MHETRERTKKQLNETTLLNPLIRPYDRVLGTQRPLEMLAQTEQRLESDPADAMTLYTRAVCLQALAETEKSNSRLELAIYAFRAVVDLENKIPDTLYRRAALQCIDRMRFRGQFLSACYSNTTLWLQQFSFG